MNEQETKKAKNIVLIIMGIVLSLAGIVYIVVQYSKLLSALILKKEDNEVDVCETKMKSRFKQVTDDEGVGPDVVEEDDLSAEI